MFKHNRIDKSSDYQLWVKCQNDISTQHWALRGVLFPLWELRVSKASGLLGATVALRL